ncbi:MAG: DUF3990 domain-containing protein [Bacteroidales bacterium]|jgi:hypothetical protein|nr:DUF3990 domain-containing protein [Bacteroidales bacterium]
MKVYHGSDTLIEEIDLDKSKYGRDFGRGFYVTSLPEQAKTMAERVARWNKTKPAVTEFEFDEFALIDNEMKILKFDGYNDEWLDFVVLNRKNREKQPAHDYDIVEGPVANDRITTRVDDFIAGLISREHFLNDLVYNPSHQICFCTVQSLQALVLPKQSIYSAVFHIGDEVMQSLMANYDLTETEAADVYYTSATYASLACETTALYQKPWQEIYEMLKMELSGKR